MTKNQKNTLTSIIESNKDYSESFNQGNLSAKPSKSIAILTCMDTRINIEKVCGLESGEAHIIRNAGGKVTDDTIRSFVVSYKLLGTKDWFVIQHTDCGLSKITDEKMASLLESDLETASFENGDWNSNKNDNSESGSSFGHQVEWNTFLDLKKSILEDIEKIKNHPLTPSYINIYGLIYDVKTGELESLEN
ncbi:carbonic anhydrase [Hyphomicrobiales bacterium]|jgi:carbonic anhydrase|nr:carbonic anhydrase [Hyphomicrobiales bacterium]MDA9904873.1 carbonic anhydrase [Hyphomicrobiales bacterium]|tara:strand:- start:160 stop:735 length:576 start_codon:yes stop_codon:yes gene_type:complete